MKFNVLLWERHLAAMRSWLEATPTMLTGHFRRDDAVQKRRHVPARKIRWRVIAFFIFLCASALGGCMVGPDYKPPRMALPANWIEASPPSSAGLEVVDLARWWTVFDDPTLVSLEERAIRSNLDLMLAEARIRQARAAVW